MDQSKNITICHKVPTPFIEVLLQGAQTRRSIQTIEVKISECIKELNNTKTLMMVGLSHIGHFDLSAVDETLFPQVNTQFERVSFYGQTGFVKEATKLVVRSAGLFYKDRIKLFETRDAALEWLLSDNLVTL